MQSTPRPFEPSQSSTEPAAAFSLPPPPKPRPVDLGRALRALRNLINNPTDTERVFEIFAGLDGGTEETFFQRFARDRQGARLLRERPSLVDMLRDRELLRAMPEGSFGRAYLEHMERTGLTAEGLLELKQDFQRKEEALRDPACLADEAREWIRDRTVLMHDLWHVLTGYGTDELGEAALLVFMLAQDPGRSMALLALGAGGRATVDVGAAFIPYLWSVYRRSSRAAWLTTLPYEELLPLPLETVRALTRIAPVSVAHPNGILRGRLDGMAESMHAAAA